MAEETNLSADSDLHPLTAGKTDYSTQDADAKRILKYRIVLANILKYAIPEYRKLPVEDIEARIPCGSMPGEKLFVKEENTEDLDAAKHIRFDVLFPVNVADSTSIDIWCDLEPQGDYKQGNASGYNLSARGVYYLSRMISRQIKSAKGDSGYNNLRKCYSIWICFDHLGDKTWEPTVSRYRFSPIVDDISNEPPERERKAADLMELIIIRAGGKEGLSNPLVDFVNTLWRDTSRLTKYIPETYEGYRVIGREVSDMCDMREVGRAQGIAEGMAKGRAEGIAKGRTQGITEGRAEGIIKMSLKFALSKAETIQALIDECNLSTEQAEKYYNLVVDREL